MVRGEFICGLGGRMRNEDGGRRAIYIMAVSCLGSLASLES